MDDATLKALNDYKAQLKEKMSALKSTQGDIKDLLKANKENRKNLDYDALNKTFEQIANIQLSRNALLAEINTILKAMVDLI
ncbi:hypothetical protein SDC9_199702 [bioreactor metagenome]|uniref:Uncharacterized protein n=1 Tax=bioreactor metagenome TaxID=1076179 RepID=A0A645ILS2_9ZZZZ